MKKKFFKTLWWFVPVLVFVGVSCSDSFLNQPAVGSASSAQLYNQAGVEQSLIGAYNALKGRDSWQGSFSGWVFGGVVGQEAYKGSNSGDQSDINPLSTFTAPATNSYLGSMWAAVYDGVNRSNTVLKLLAKVPAGAISDSDVKRITAEAKFLRGFYHMYGKMLWNNIPYIDETIDYSAGNYRVPNTEDAWPKIIKDFTDAIADLPASGLAAGRANKSAAQAFLGKCYMLKGDYENAFTTFQTVIGTGVNQAGTKYDLNDKFRDAFDATNDNSKESVFAIQSSVNDGSGASNANPDLVLNYPYLGSLPVSCCGFYQPSMDQANSYRTSGGLPLLDGSYNSATNQLSDVQWTKGASSVTADALPLDPRIDWIVGRTGVPFFDWGTYSGPAWVRQLSDAGPYSPKKLTFPKSEIGAYTDNSSWTPGYSAVNYNLMRFADVLLLAAEAAVEKNTPDLATALTYVNKVRKRAQNPDGFVKISTDSHKTDWQAYLDTSIPSKPAGNYVISLYTSFPDKDYARKAIRFERKLELGMEGHRFFDLVRWGDITVPGGSQNTSGNPVNLQMAYEYNASLAGASIYGDFRFQKGKSEYFPIPQSQIDLSNGTLKQNPGYGGN